MVLEAFLLIHMGGSGTFYDTESNKSCMIEENCRNSQVEICIKNPDANERNIYERVFVFDEFFYKPDSIINSNSLHSAQPIPVFSAKTKLLNRFEIEPPKPENLSEVPKPQFALTFEQNNMGNFGNILSKALDNTKPRSKISIFRQNESFDFSDKIIPHSKTNPQQDWFSIFLFSSIVLIAWIRSFFGRYFQQSLQSLYDFTLSSRLFRNKNVLLPRISFMLLVNFIIILSLFTFKSLEIINISIFKTSFSNFIILNFIFLMMITFRLVSFHGLKILFPRNQPFMEYHYQVQNFYKSIGLLILPILIFETYFPAGNSKFFIWSGIGVIFILYALRILRGQRIIKRMNFPFSYLFLYIITFEILPISICFKIFSQII